MSTERIIAARYAILIGINAYPGAPLEGCVRDVESIKAYLEAMLGATHIEMFTASKNTNPESSAPAEDPDRRPTYQNVTSALEKITNLGKAGDAVYIHYSGHGTRGSPSSQFSNQSTGDLALVLLNDGGENSIKYLWGHILAVFLKAMADRRAGRHDCTGLLLLRECLPQRQQSRYAISTFSMPRSLCSLH